MKQRVWLDRELPPPLEADREKEAIYAFKVEYNMEARELLIEHGLRLVLCVVNGFSYIDIDLNELLSVGTIGLIKAVDAFEPEKGSKLQALSVSVLRMKFYCS